MGYFMLYTSFPTPHVEGELQSLEAAKEQLGDHDVYTDEQMRQHPELKEALERSDSGDRSLYRIDHARYALSLVAGDGDIGEALAYIGEDVDQYRELAATEPTCAIVAELFDTVADLQTRIKVLGIPESARDVILPRGSWEGQVATWGRGLRDTLETV